LAQLRATEQRTEKKARKKQVTDKYQVSSSRRVGPRNGNDLNKLQLDRLKCFRGSRKTKQQKNKPSTLKTAPLDGP